MILVLLNMCICTAYENNDDFYVHYLDMCLDNRYLKGAKRIDLVVFLVSMYQTVN